MTDHQAVYDDAELLAIQIARDAAAEDGAAPGWSLSETINGRLVEFQAQHGSLGLLGVVVAMARHANVALAAARGSFEAVPGWLDEFEMSKIGQHQYEKDNPEDV